MTEHGQAAREAFEVADAADKTVQHYVGDVSSVAPVAFGLPPDIPQSWEPRKKARWNNSNSQAEPGGLRKPVPTRRCFHFDNGHCAYGQECYFAHVDVADKWSSSKWAELCFWYVTQRECANGDDCPFLHAEPTNVPKYPKKALQKMKEDSNQFCHFFKMGLCAFGDGCHYAHANQDEISCGCGRANGIRCVCVPSSQSESGFKTALCAAFTESGDCAVENCWYAHGAKELRTPALFFGTSYKNNVCSYYLIEGANCNRPAYMCPDAHGDLDLRRIAIESPPDLMIREGTRLKCWWKAGVSILTSAEEDAASSGKLECGAIVIASGLPRHVGDGTVEEQWFVPIQPEGFVDAQALQVVPAEEENKPVVSFVDAHVHLDVVLLTRTWGKHWYYKTKACTRGPGCYLGQFNACNYAHSAKDALKKPRCAKEDFCKLADEILATPGANFAGCVHICCDALAIDESLDLVQWGREYLDGRIYVGFGIHPSEFEQYTPEMEARRAHGFSQLVMSFAQFYLPMRYLSL
eukprot:TRINITY_DN30105_c0_g1_i3.p1 TRINITY_DN30105_c0_g1~~TRINITY_DN30105_c0_g1_i3.p1  ORF type:complete len:522 (+),score=83.27 TRINITY_DN30105_c0_g1_i3:88-1653(+)